MDKFILCVLGLFGFMYGVWEVKDKQAKRRSQNIPCTPREYRTIWDIWWNK